MVDQYETDKRRRFDAGVQAIEVLMECGFGVLDFDINVEEPRDTPFEVRADLSITENTDPMDSFSDEEDTDLGNGSELSKEFVLGLTAGVMMSGAKGCEKSYCPYED